MASDPLDQLQSMFPTIEGDVIAIVFSESDKDGECLVWVGARAGSVLVHNAQCSDGLHTLPSLTKSYTSIKL